MSTDWECSVPLEMESERDNPRGSTVTAGAVFALSYCTLYRLSFVNNAFSLVVLLQVPDEPFYFPVLIHG